MVGVNGCRDVRRGNDLVRSTWRGIVDGEKACLAVARVGTSVDGNPEIGEVCGIVGEWTVRPFIRRAGPVEARRKERVGLVDAAGARREIVNRRLHFRLKSSRVSNKGHRSMEAETAMGATRPNVRSKNSSHLGRSPR